MLWCDALSGDDLALQEWIDGLEALEAGIASPSTQSSFVMSSDCTVDRSPEVISAELPFTNCCWGVALTGNDSRCDSSSRALQSRHFIGKFCSNCRRHGCWLRNRVRALRENTEDGQRLTNRNRSSGKGCWSNKVEDVCYRIVNNAAVCTGPKLVIFDQPVPQWALDLTEPVFSDDRSDILLRHKHGTLVPDWSAPREIPSEAAPTCWGGELSGDGSKCDPNFTPKSRKFNKRFCDHCLLNGFWLFGRTRQLPLDATIERLGATQSDAISKGCWHYCVKDACFRVVDTKQTRGPKTLIIFNQLVPAWALDVTEPIFNDNRCEVHVRVKNNTINLFDNADGTLGSIGGSILSRTPQSLNVVPDSSMTNRYTMRLLSVKPASTIECTTTRVIASPFSLTQLVGLAGPPVATVAKGSVEPGRQAMLPCMWPGWEMTGAGGHARGHANRLLSAKRPFAELASPPCSPPAQHPTAQIDRYCSSSSGASVRKIQDPPKHLQSTPHRRSTTPPAPLSLLVDDALPEEQSPFTFTFCHAPLEDAYRSDTFTVWLPRLRCLRWLHFASDAWDTVDSIVFERGRRYETYTGFSLWFTLWYPVVLTLASAIWVSLPVNNKNTCASATIVQMLAYGIGNLAPSISAFGMIDHTEEFEQAASSAGSREELVALMELTSRHTAASVNVLFIFTFCSAIMATGTLIPPPVVILVAGTISIFYVLHLKTIWGQLGLVFTFETWVPQV